MKARTIAAFIFLFLVGIVTSAPIGKIFPPPPWGDVGI